MGSRFRDPDHTNPQGFWEDLDFHDLNKALIHAQITYGEWRHVLKSRIAFRRSTGKPWGFKCPLLCYLLERTLIYLPPEPLLIRCRRPLDAVAESCRRCYGWENAEQVVRDRETRLDLTLAGKRVHEIDFRAPRSDSELIQKLQHIVDYERGQRNVP